MTLWKDFDDSLPPDEEILGQQTEDGAIVREVCFYGRRTKQGRVKIYANYFMPSEETRFPVVMILFEAGAPFDRAFAKRFVARGYGVLCVDYCGENGTEKHTVYPDDIPYANYANAGRHLEYAEPSAKETSWYEWTCVARYAARYLAERKEVTAVGALGLRAGGEILFKIAPYAPISCMISACAAGWLAYRGMEKFSDDKQFNFDEERYRFIAGIDSQSYAPYVKCPVLLLSAINDKKHDYDRVYDTFRLINPEVEKAILFSTHGNGLLGSHSMADLDLFLDKYLKGRSVFICKKASLTIEEDAEGNLIVRGLYDKAGEIKDYGIFFTEKSTTPQARDWTRVLGKPADLDDNVGVLPLSLYAGSQKALVYTFVNYSNNFSVTSQIQEVTIKKPYKNSSPKSRVIYCNADGLNGFSAFSSRTQAIADCFADGVPGVTLLPGYGGIKGIYSPSGLISYRVGEARYESPEHVSLRFDAYAKADARIRVTFYRNAEEKNGYSAEARVEGGGKWKSILFDANDFKSETGEHLEDFTGVVSVVFMGEGEVLVNNVLWI